MKAEDIKRLRISLGWSQERFARELGVSFCTVNRWERGKTVPSPMAIKFLANVQEKAGLKRSRGAKRIAKRLPINVEKLHDTDKLTFSGYTDNISTGGVMFTAPFRLKTGERLRIALILENEKGVHEVEALSEVVWTEPHETEDSQHSVGVRFNEIHDLHKAAIANTIYMN